MRSGSGRVDRREWFGRRNRLWFSWSVGGAGILFGGRGSAYGGVVNGGRLMVKLTTDGTILSAGWICFEGRGDG